MTRPSLAAVFALSVAATAAEPDFVPVRERDGTYFIERTVTRYRAVNRTVTRMENGMPVSRTVAETVPETVQVETALDAAAGDFFDPAGDRIDPKELPKLLRKGAVIAIAREAKPLDPEVRKRNPDVVAVLVPGRPEPATPPGAAPAASPPAPKVPADDEPFGSDAVLKDGAIVVRRLVTVRQQVMKQENRTTQDGKTVTVAVPALVPVTREATLSLDPKALTVETTDGKTVEPAEWEKRLKEGKVKVIVLPSDKPVPEAVRKANKDAVLILRVKAKP